MKILVATLLLINILNLSAQSLKQVSETEINPAAMSKLYAKYPHARITGWYDRSFGDDKLRASKIDFEGKKILVIFNESETKVISEEVSAKEDISTSITYNLDLKYKKYKIKEFRKVTDFLSKESFYSLELNTKQGQKVILYDEMMIPLGNKDLKSFYTSLINNKFY